MREIGPIVLLQVQVSSLKVGEAPRKRYDPSPILAVPALELSPAGAVGLLPDGERVIDVHNRRHEATKQRQGINGLSLGFTAHYAAMRRRFGDVLPDGMAGENILVASDRRWTEEELAPGLVIETATRQRLAIARIIVAAPCVEFTRWVSRFPDEARPDRTVTAGVRFLDHGLRGFYAA
ncbi:MAG: hypothetical protein ACRDJ9_24285, partial [Dehalococcoidia bacterium]